MFSWGEIVVAIGRDCLDSYQKTFRQKKNRNFAAALSLKSLILTILTNVIGKC